MGISFVGLERGMSMAEKKIEDFGEKIGGARKDLYALNRELRYGDILDWNDMEKEKYITKAFGSDTLFGFCRTKERYY